MQATFVGSGPGDLPDSGKVRLPPWLILILRTSTEPRQSTSFGTALPSAPGTQGQALLIDTVPDGTHITTGWEGSY